MRGELFEQHQADVPFLRASPALGGIEADAVVLDRQPDTTVDVLDPHVHARRLRVLESVTNRLTRCAEHQLLGLGIDLERLVDVQLDVDAAALQRRDQVGERGFETGGAEVLRVDRDKQRPESLHARTRDRGALLQRRAQLRVVARPRLRVRRCRKRVRDAREVLHDAVVQVGGDPTSFVVRRVERAAEQELAFFMAAVNALREPVRKRNLDEPQQQERREQRRHERQPDAASTRHDRVEALVELEQHGPSARRADARIDLQQLALRTLEPVLGTVEIAQLGMNGPGLERPLLFPRRGDISHRSDAARPNTRRARPATRS
jgi:hypothetical protein